MIAICLTNVLNQRAIGADEDGKQGNTGFIKKLIITQGELESKSM